MSDEPDVEIAPEPETAPEAGPAPAPEPEIEPEPETAPEPARSPTPEVVRTSVAGEIARRLAAAGSRFAFTVPGESFLPLIDALEGAGIRVVVTRHEGGAAFMAAASAQLSGRPQSVLVTRTVGAANAAIGIHAARSDSVPLIALVGQVERPNQGREAFQESDLVHGIGSLADWARQVGEPRDTPRIVSEGLFHLGHGRPGPILLSLPEDILDETIEGGSEGLGPPRSSGPAADRSAVRTILRWLAASERGLILAGGGVLRGRASKRLVALSEVLAVPVMASWRRPDVFPNDHPNYLGMTGFWAPSTVRSRLVETDVLLVLGSRLSEVATFGYTIPAPGTRWAHVDLQPRASQAGLAPPSLSVAADASRFLDAAWSDLRAAALDAEMRIRREEAMERDRAAYLAATRVDEGEWEGPGVHPGRAITSLQGMLPANAIITSDAGNFAGWLNRGYRFTRAGTFLGPTSGAMGYGLPAAIAASLVHPDRVVVAVCGDGGFAMTMAEIETAVREGVRPIVLVFDNQRYGTIAMHQAREGRSTRSSELGAIDFVAVAQGLGAWARRVESDAEVGPALAEALAAGRPAVISLRLDPAWVSVDQPPWGGA